MSDQPQKTMSKAEKAVIAVVIIVLIIIILYRLPSMLGHSEKATPAPVAPAPVAAPTPPPAPITVPASPSNKPITSWSDVLAQTEIDPGTIQSHQDFVKDVKRFSSGANFTSVTDDNTSDFFVNFRGLRRPQHVPIGVDARQVPDVDETVLMRNKDFRWT